jgi:multiple sugar transport system permease protein
MAAPDQMKSRPPHSRLQGNPWTPYLFAAPVAIYLILFQFYPLAQQFYLSFTATDLLRPDINPRVGLSNYEFLFEIGNLHRVLWITAIYTICCVVFAVGLGLGTAMLLDSPFVGRGVARALVTVPWAAPSVAVALIFAWMYNAQYGIFNHTLRWLSLPFGHDNWLDNPSLALPAILITTIWQIFPFSSVVILAALQGVPQELREAAAIDGADRYNIFKTAVWPTIQPTVLMLVLFVTIWSLRRFDLIWLMTQGGPIGATNTLVIELYRQGFVFRQLGTAAAVGMIGLTVALVITIIYFKYIQMTERAQGKR